MTFDRIFNPSECILRAQRLAIRRTGSGGVVAELSDDDILQDAQRVIDGAWADDGPPGRKRRRLPWSARIDLNSVPTPAGFGRVACARQIALRIVRACGENRIVVGIESTITASRISAYRSIRVVGRRVRWGRLTICCATLGRIGANRPSEAI
jgi:hypothetical protein